MFCCKCGAKTPGDANFCNKCGSSLYREAAEHSGGLADNRAASGHTPEGTAQPALIKELLAIDPKPHECHACGRRDKLFAWDFGMARRISTKRAWGESALSIALSAASLPLLGVGVLTMPGKKIRYQVLRLRLVFCERCCRQNRASAYSRRLRSAAYSVHPWFEVARRIGYTEFLGANALDKLVKPQT
jgi:hypothetical protein